MKNFVVAYPAAGLLALACVLQAAANAADDLCERVLTAGGVR